MVNNSCKNWMMHSDRSTTKRSLVKKMEIVIQLDNNANNVLHLLVHVHGHTLGEKGITIFEINRDCANI